MEWLKPYTDDAIRELGQSGTKSLLAVPISFVSEHIETLEEMDMEYKELALESGIQNWGRVPALNTNETFINDLAELVIEKLPSAQPRPGYFTEALNLGPPTGKQLLCPHIALIESWEVIRSQLDLEINKQVGMHINRHHLLSHSVELEGHPDTRAISSVLFHPLAFETAMPMAPTTCCEEGAALIKTCFVGPVGELLDTYDRDRRVLPPPVRMWQFGWTKSAEVLNGRIAMVSHH